MRKAYNKLLTHLPLNMHYIICGHPIKLVSASLLRAMMR